MMIFSNSFEKKSFAYAADQNRDTRARAEKSAAGKPMVSSFFREKFAVFAPFLAPFFGHGKKNDLKSWREKKSLHMRILRINLRARLPEQKK